MAHPRAAALLFLAIDDRDHATRRQHRPCNPALFQRRVGRPAHEHRTLHQRGHAPSKVAAETAKMDVFGTDYSTPDGTCIRDYVHVSDRVARLWSWILHARSD